MLNEIKRERHQAEVGATTPESVRVAQLSNEVEKRDAVIVKLKVENESLTVCVLHLILCLVIMFYVHVLCVLICVLFWILCVMHV